MSGNSSTAATPSSTACFKCGQEGHYSSCECNHLNLVSICLGLLFSLPACTNNAKSTSRAKETPSYGSCFKCGQEGHFSNGDTIAQ